MILKTLKDMRIPWNSLKIPGGIKKYQRYAYLLIKKVIFSTSFKRSYDF